MKPPSPSPCSPAGFREILTARIVIFLSARLPSRLSEALASLLAKLYWHLRPAAQRRVHIDAVQAALPEIGRKRAARILQRSAANFMRNFIDAARLPQRFKPGKLEFEVEDPEGALPLLSQPCILVSGHLDSWELGGAFLLRRAELNPTLILSRPVKNSILDQFWTAQRLAVLEGTPARVVQRLAPGDARETMQAVLRDRHSLLMLVDQRVRRGGLPLTFLNRSAWSTITPARLALQTGNPILFWHCTRLDARRLRLTLGPVLRADAFLDAELRGDKPAEAQAAYLMAQRLQDILSACVRAAPERWIWQRHRWSLEGCTPSPLARHLKQPRSSE